MDGYRGFAGPSSTAPNGGTPHQNYPEENDYQQTLIFQYNPNATFNFYPGSRPGPTPPQQIHAEAHNPFQAQQTSPGFQLSCPALGPAMGSQSWNNGSQQLQGRGQSQAWAMGSQPQQPPIASPSHLHQRMHIGSQDGLTGFQRRDGSSQGSNQGHGQHAPISLAIHYCPCQGPVSTFGSSNLGQMTGVGGGHGQRQSGGSSTFSPFQPTFYSTPRSASHIQNHNHFSSVSNCTSSGFPNYPDAEDMIGGSSQYSLD